MIYYTYRIDFADGDYYYGYKGSDDPELDGYFGSPATNKIKWETHIHCKVVLEIFDTRKEAYEAECDLIGDLHKTDPKCLNACNRGKSFYRAEYTKESAERIGKGVRQFHLNNPGIFKGKKRCITPEGRQGMAERNRRTAAKRKGSKHNPESIQRMKEGHAGRLDAPTILLIESFWELGFTHCHISEIIGVSPRAVTKYMPEPTEEILHLQWLRKQENYKRAWEKRKAITQG